MRLGRRLNAFALSALRGAARPIAGMLDGGAQPDEAILARWWQGERNWGDAINPVLIRLLSGCPVRSSSDVWNIESRPVYSVVGSVLDDAAEPCLVVWGSGFMFRHGRMLVRPREVKAVRGALTRAKLLDQGIGCPAIFGDPALLYADHVKVPRVLSGRIGIVPHFADQQLPEVKAVVEKHGFHLIDILGDIDDVVRSISGCDWVASSSLHGLVIADAYGVPNVWVKLSDNVMGGSFKFHDYFSGVGRAETGPVRVGPDTTLHELEDQVFSGRIEFDRDTLLAACPFLAGSGGDVKDPVSGGGFR